MRLLKVLCAFALVATFATVSCAEVQNVKVSGDLNMYVFHRDDMDCDADDHLNGGESDETQNWFQSLAQIQVDADLTDNVSTCIRLANQRDWDDPSVDSPTSTVDYDIGVDLAYVTLKEMLYSPLTLTIGRQDIWLGDGLILGKKVSDLEGSIEADEYTTYTAFDAIRATLDYDPWTVDLVYSKIEENNNDVDGNYNNDDADLYIANVGYVFDSYNAEAEAYLVAFHDRTSWTAGNTVASETDTFGIRGSFDPIEDATIKGELAHQLGDFRYPGTAINRDRSAMLFDLAGEYRFPEMRWTPKVGLEYIYMSGEVDDASGDTGDWEGWNPLFCGRSITYIHSVHNIYYDTAYRGASDMGDFNNNADQDSGLSNIQYVLLSGSVAPTENLTIDALYAHCRLAEKVSDANSDEEAGDELDITLTYDYTEDVTFGLVAAWFFPGNYFPSDQDNDVTDIVGSMSVKF